MKQDLYTIQEVSTLIGVSPKTLRRWEQTGKIKPIRTVGNQRRYRIEDIKKLERRRRLQKVKQDVRKEIVSASSVPGNISTNKQEVQPVPLVRPIVREVFSQTPSEFSTPIAKSVVKKTEKELIKHRPDSRAYFKPFMGASAVILVLILAA